MSRCKACDAALTDREGKWDAELKQHEELCNKCIGAVFDDEANEEIESLYNTPIDLGLD